MVTVIVGLIAWRLFGYLFLGGLYIVVGFWKAILAIVVYLVLGVIGLKYSDS
jgi:hypothetical protein